MSGEGFDRGADEAQGHADALLSLPRASTRPFYRRGYDRGLTERLCRTHFATIRDGGVWGVPRSGLVFRRRGGTLELANRMPYSEDLQLAGDLGLDVPPDAAALRAFQDADYELIRSRFEAAGIPVRDTTTEQEKGATQ